MQVTEINVALEEKKPNQDALSIKGVEFTFDNEGPSVLITGAIHGNEIVASATCWKLVNYLKEEQESNLNFKLSKITIVPLVNELGARALTREVPLEGYDPNRNFPGTPYGVLSQRFNFVLTTLLEHHDALIDVHGCGEGISHIILHTSKTKELKDGLLQIVKDIDLPVLVDTRDEDDSTLDSFWSVTALNMGKPSLTLELPGFNTIKVKDTALGVENILKLLHNFSKPIDINASPNLDNLYTYTVVLADASGFFERYVDKGEKVIINQSIGSIIDTYTGWVKPVLSTVTGKIMFVQTNCIVHPGSILYAILIKIEL